MILKTSSTVDASLTAHTAVLLTLHKLTLGEGRHTAAAPRHQTEARQSLHTLLHESFK
jgi:hypothetical protein